MSTMLTKIPACLAGLVVLVPLSAAGPRVPNFSGDWVLATATASGAGRSSGTGAAQTADERPTTSHTASGAAFNCGRECTIVHQAETLKVENAFLASETSPAPAVTFQLDGRPRSVINSVGRAGELPVTATLNGEKLEIVTRPERFPIGYSQWLSLDGTQLVVVTSSDRARVTLTYKKK